MVSVAIVMITFLPYVYQRAITSQYALECPGALVRALRFRLFLVRKEIQALQSQYITSYKKVRINLYMVAKQRNKFPLLFFFFFFAAVPFFAPAC